MKHRRLTTLTPGWANLVFALVTIALIGGSGILAALGFPALGVLYNQFIIVGAAVLLACFGRWSWREVFRFKIPRGSFVLLAVAAGVSAWWVNAGILVTLQRWLDRVIGPLPDIDPDFGPWGILAILFATLILAPLCEEILFRGYIQRAYEYTHPSRAWIYSGLLFGVLHVGNALTSVVTASLLGLLLGYVVWKSDSIFPAIVSHFAINFCALVFALPVHSALTSPGTPWWLAVASLVGLGLMILFIKLFNRQAAQVEAQSAKELAPGAEIEVLPLPHPRPNSLALRVLPIIAALLILGLAAFGEIALRAGWIEIPQENSQGIQDTSLGEVHIFSINPLNK